MPALKKTDHVAKVVWLGSVAMDTPENRINSHGHAELSLDYGGVSGELHYGETRASCVRVKDLYKEGTEIRNVRQLSIISKEELDQIAAEVGLAEIKPEWLGATVVLEGLADFTHVPPSSRLQSPSGVTLTIDMENRPCIWPGKEIEREHPGYGPKFKQAAKDRRGVTAWVEHPGQLRLGEDLQLFVPDQRPWAP